jgi:hypothetical protein
MEEQMGAIKTDERKTMDKILADHMKLAAAFRTLSKAGQDYVAAMCPDLSTLKTTEEKDNANG